MLHSFQTGVCRRLPYVILLVAMLAFDWAKGPVEDFLERAADTVHAEVSASEQAVLDRQFGELARLTENRLTDQQRPQARQEAA